MLVFLYLNFSINNLNSYDSIEFRDHLKPRREFIETNALRVENLDIESDFQIANKEPTKYWHICI